MKMCLLMTMYVRDDWENLIKNVSLLYTKGTSQPPAATTVAAAAARSVASWSSGSARWSDGPSYLTPLAPAVPCHARGCGRLSRDPNVPRGGQDGQPAHPRWTQAHLVW